MDFVGDVQQLVQAEDEERPELFQRFERGPADNGDLERRKRKRKRKRKRTQ